MPTHYQGSPEETQILNAYIKLVRASNSVVRKITPTIASSGLTMTQFGALDALHHLGPLCQRELADKLLVTPGNITMVVGNLEKRGLIVKLKNGRDKRYATLHLTWRGTQVFEELFPRHLKDLGRVFRTLNDEDLQQLGELCRRLGTGH